MVKALKWAVWLLWLSVRAALVLLLLWSGANARILYQTF